MPSSGKSRRHRKNRPSDSKHNKQHSKNGGNNGGAGGPAVTAALVQSPVTSPMEDVALPLMVDATGGCGKPNQELLSAAAAAVEMAGPPLPADAAMMEVAGTPSDEDDPAFNAFNYWKTPFPDVNADVIME